MKAFVIEEQKIFEGIMKAKVDLGKSTWRGG